MHEYLFQTRLERVQFGKADVLDLLDNMVPVDVVHTLPTRDAAQQRGLALRPGEGITIVQVVRHGVIIAS